MTIHVFNNGGHLEKKLFSFSFTFSLYNYIEYSTATMHKDWSLQCHFLVLKSGPPFLTVVER